MTLIRRPLIASLIGAIALFLWNIAVSPWWINSGGFIR